MSELENEEADLTNPLQRQFERKIVSPFDSFVHYQISGGVVLVAATIAALWLANSPYRDVYRALDEITFGVHAGDWQLTKSLHHWVNDGLMALFFFVLGLEIKREMLAGDLRDRQRFTLIAMAAVGGMVVPAAIFAGFNMHDASLRGWAIPMATDTAFAIGALALLGSRVPKAATLFLVALAIVDDIGAILVIALFYTDTISFAALGAALGFLLVLILFNVLGLRRPALYALVSVMLWLAVLYSGLHATLAGVLAALAIPARPRVVPRRFIARTRSLLRRVDTISPQQSILADEQQHAAVEEVEREAQLATTPLQRWKHSLEMPVTFFVVPVFAFLNAGVEISTSSLSGIFSSPVAVGVVAGLVFGKVIGITLMSWLGIHFGLGRLADDVTLRHIIGIGLLAGMGFTMSIFIATLGFADSPALLLDAKMGILAATFLAGSLGMAWLWVTPAATRKN